MAVKGDWEEEGSGNRYLAKLRIAVVYPMLVNNEFCRFVILLRNCKSSVYKRSWFWNGGSPGLG